MKQLEETVIRYHDGIAAELFWYQPLRCNRPWGPEYFFFGETPPTERVIDGIAAIKVLRGR